MNENDFIMSFVASYLATWSASESKKWNPLYITNLPVKDALLMAKTAWYEIEENIS